MSGDNVELVELDFPAQDDIGVFAKMPWCSPSVMGAWQSLGDD
jgi:hypothetical protein